MSSDFKKFFEASNLDERSIGEIAFILTSPAYEHSFKPYMQGILRGLHQLQRDRSQERKMKYSDDYLAGGMDFGDGLLEFFEQLITETDSTRIMDAMANMTPERLYDVKRHRGEMRPAVGLDQQALPQMADPDEF